MFQAEKQLTISLFHTEKDYTCRKLVSRKLDSHSSLKD